MEKWCFSCKHCIVFKDGLYLCALARNFIPNIKLGADCEFYRPGRFILDDLHVNDAMERNIEENDLSVSGKE